MKHSRPRPYDYLRPDNAEEILKRRLAEAFDEITNKGDKEDSDSDETAMADDRLMH